MRCFADILARSSIIFGNAAFADRIVLAASRLLGAAAACVKVLSFGAGNRKSYWSGCNKVAIVIRQQIFSTTLSFAAGHRKHWSGCINIAIVTVICQQIFSILALVISFH